jgi:hypothetical protein
MRFVFIFAIIWAMIIGFDRRRQSLLRRAQESSDKYMEGVRSAGSSPAARARAKARNDYYRRLNEKYIYAAKFPWLPVASDPPEPK